MTKIVCVGDIHVSDKAPASATDSYTDDIIEMLRWVADYANEIDADAVVWAGDVFHHKAPSKNSHALVLKMIDVVKYHRVPLWCVTGNHDCCVTEDTEALTDQGWRRVTELEGTERFATMNRSTGQIEWQIPTAINRYHHTGLGYELESNSVSLRVTPNHAFWGADRRGKSLIRKTAEQLYYGFSVPARASLVGEESETIQLGSGRSVPLEIAAPLLGWYVAEGTADRSGSRFTISQSASVNPDHYAEIEELVRALGNEPRCREKMIRVCDRALTEFLISEFGYAGSKDMRLPLWLMEWPLWARREFLHAYFRGDGTISGSREVRAAAGYETASVQARTANADLASDLQWLGSLSGYRVSVGAEREFPVGEYVGHARNVSFQQKAVMTTLPRKVPIELDEMVWCPSLPNETWLARRNGKTVWSGNSNGIVDQVRDRQPLGVLYEAGLNELSGWHPTLPLFGVPWRETWTDPGDAMEAFTDWRVVPDRIFARNGGWAQDGTETWETNLSKALAVTHAPIYPPGEAEKQLFELVPLAGPEGLSAAMGNVGSLYYGHIHEDHGIFTVDGVTYANMGAISRGSLHEYNLERRIKVAVWTDPHVPGLVYPEGECPSPTFTEVAVPHKPASEVFRLAEVAETKASKLSLEEFLQDVGTRTVDISSTGSVVAHINNRDDVEPHIRKKAVDFIEKVS